MLLEDSDIDDWFAEEKRKLTSRTQEAIEKGASSEKECKRLSNDLQKLLKKYDQMYRKAAAARKRHAKIEAPLVKFKNWRKARGRAWRHWKTSLGERWKDFKFRIHYKWLFRKH